MKVKAVKNMREKPMKGLNAYLEQVYERTRKSKLYMKNDRTIRVGVQYLLLHLQGFSVETLDMRFFFTHYTTNLTGDLRTNYPSKFLAAITEKTSNYTKTNQKKIEDTVKETQIENGLDPILPREEANKNRKQNKTDRQLIKNTLKIGQKALHSRSKYLKSFVNSWNYIINLGGEANREMWKLYNEIQIKYNAPLQYVHYKNSPAHLRLKQDIVKVQQFHEKTLKKYPNLKLTTLMTEWLKFQDKIKGKNPLIEIKIINPLNEKDEVWYIRNKKNKWNPNGLSHQTGTAEERFVHSALFEEWGFIRPYQKKKGKLMPYSVKKIILKELFPNRAIPNGTIFQQVYRLRADMKSINHFFESKWVEFKKTVKQINETRPKLQKLNKYYKDFKIKDNLIPLEIDDIFEIYLLDKSRYLLLNLFKGLQIVVDYQEENFRNLDDWWLAIRDKVTVEQLAELLLEATYNSPIMRVPMTYKLSDAMKTRFGPLSTDPVRFWTEAFDDGVSGLAASLIENQTIRQTITNFSKEHSEIRTLFLPTNALTTMTGHDTTTPGRLVTVPDCITKVGERGGVYQNKILRPIGENSDEINAENFLLDFIKTIGNYDPISNTVNNLKLEFIPRGDSLNGLTDLAKEHNAVIISYWEKSMKELGRFMEVISAMRLVEFKRQRKQFFLEKDIRKFVEKNLKAANMLGSKTVTLDPETLRIIDKFIPEVINASGEGTFLKNSLIKLFRLYGDRLISKKSIKNEAKMNPPKLYKLSVTRG